MTPRYLTAALLLLTLATAPEIQGEPSRRTAAQVGQVLFIENVGQVDPAVRFQVWGGGQTLGLADDAIWLSLVEGSKVQGSQVDEPDLQPATAQHVNIRLSFPGANPHPVLEPFDRLDTHVSYFLGSDPTQWQPDVPVWGGVRYRDLFPGVNLELTGTSGRWQWRLVSSTPSPVVTPAGRSGGSSSPAAAGEGWGGGLTLRVEGADATVIDGATLRLTTALGDLAVPLIDAGPKAPAAPQIMTAAGDATTFEIRSPFAAAAGLETAAAGAYPLLYATYLGGSQPDRAWGIAVDAAGAAYVAGDTWSPNLPAVEPGYDTSHSGWYDAFVAKLTPEGTSLAYLTFLGGRADDSAWSVEVDTAGAAYVAGHTWSADFPASAAQGYDTAFNGGYYDAFAVKLAPDGTALAYATFLGGGDVDYARAIAVDAAGAAYVAGNTGSSDFPAAQGRGYDTTFNDGYGSDAFVVKLAPDGEAVSYATFLGGSDYDSARAIAIDSAGAAYVAGSTMSADFPAAIGPGFDMSYHSGHDAFVAKLAPDGMRLTYATYLGGMGCDAITGITVDRAGAAYAAGYTWSSDFPAATGPGYDTSYNGDKNGDAFAVKLAPQGLALIYATFLGGSSYDYAAAVAVDDAGAAYIVGNTQSLDFPATAGPGYATVSNGGNSDGFVLQLTPDGTRLAYATFLGGGSSDFVAAIAAGGPGAAYVAGNTRSTNFPATIGPGYDRGYNGGDNDAFVVKLVTGELPPETIRGAVWNDSNGDRTRAADEPGIAGVQVCAELLGHRAVRCTISGSDGAYALEVAPGAYLAATSGAPAGLRRTTPGFRLPVIVRKGQQVWNIDFGFR